MNNGFQEQLYRLRETHVLRALNRCAGSLTSRELCEATYLSAHDMAPILVDLQKGNKVECHKHPLFGDMYLLRRTPEEIRARFEKLGHGS